MVEVGSDGAGTEGKYWLLTQSPSARSSMLQNLIVLSAFKLGTLEDNQIDVYVRSPNEQVTILCLLRLSQSMP